MRSNIVVGTVSFCQVLRLLFCHSFPKGFIVFHNHHEGFNSFRMLQRIECKFQIIIIIVID